jgi:hypothetical protein
MAAAMAGGDRTSAATLTVNLGTQPLEFSSQSLWRECQPVRERWATTRQYSPTDLAVRRPGRN